jgi:hypothetical protein
MSRCVRDSALLTKECRNDEPERHETEKNPEGAEGAEGDEGKMNKNNNRMGKDGRHTDSKRITKDNETKRLTTADSREPELGVLFRSASD